VIWFGANDANKNPIQAQYVPPDRFKKNLLEIINHPVVTVHSPNIILITPPPFEETMLVKLQEEWGVTPPTRKAADAQEYAELVKEVGKEAGVPVLDVWSAFMEKAGWKAGDPLPIPGTLELGKSKELEELSYDGELGGIRGEYVKESLLLTRLKVYMSAPRDTESYLVSW
jgi:lysophospholipase L1-like esterase